MPKDTLGEFELLVILAALRVGQDRAYTVSIAEVIEERTGRAVRRANVHTTLRRLEAKGFVTTRLGESRPERGGKPRRLVRVKPEGIAAARAMMGDIQSLAAGLGDALGHTA